MRNTCLSKEKTPVITIDGPSGVGKGTVAGELAETLGWHFLDSGAIYRLLALTIVQNGQVLNASPDQWAKMAKELHIRFAKQRIYLDGHDVTDAIRDESIGLLASKVSAISSVREALLERQRAFAQAPGLVTDGRDMGSVVFPSACLKFYLDAAPEVRARRRERQLKDRGINVTFVDLLEDIKKRDQQDSSRLIAPLIIPEGAVTIDTSFLNKTQVFEKVMSYVYRHLDVGNV
ncbi:MAG: (d)CMP kinase [Gammaproteobacteria bacterium]|nr:(d)CMP kinase [Gammaproteobacteria bacterium]MCD8542734.1 (d)CMP kinase [Gammaproteobacteria bacterium]MCD8573906.1 (d)CMP kinase [Gammaproteobacteria bacterium]